MVNQPVSEKAGIYEDDIFDDEQPKKDVLEKNGYKDPIPLLENSRGSYGEYRLVGNGGVTNLKTCGKRATLKGCLRVDLHNLVTLERKNYRGKVFVRRIKMSCGKPSCPKCFKSGWAIRQAGKIEYILKEASKRFGQVEHIVCSVPTKDYGLKDRTLRRKVIAMLKEVGVVGGCVIFHAFRYKPYKGWYFSPHFHILGFILGGYRCRGCKLEGCRVCGGFEGRVYELYDKSGYIVRVLSKRKTIFGTAWYQLNHASYKVGVKRFHVATWFGNCSYRKLKVTAEMRKEFCPICQHELVKIRYLGDKRLNLSLERDSFEDYEEDGQVVFVERVHRWNGLAVARQKWYSEEDIFHLKDDWVDKMFPKGGDNCA